MTEEKKLIDFIKKSPSCFIISPRFRHKKEKIPNLC